MGYEPAMRTLILMCLIGSMAAAVMTLPGDHRPHPHVVDPVGLDVRDIQ